MQPIDHTAMSLPYYNNCVNWRRNDVSVEGGLYDMCSQANHITRRTFLRHVNRAHLKEVERDLSYEDHPSKGLTMAGDYHVSYHRSKLHGKRVYFFCQSSIEYVFANHHENLPDLEH